MRLQQDELGGGGTTCWRPVQACGYCALVLLLGSWVALFVGMWHGCTPHPEARHWSAAELAAVRQALGQIDSELDHVQALKTDMGYHIVQVISRKVTRLEDVVGALRKELRARAASPVEAEVLRKRLFAEHEVRIK